MNGSTAPLDAAVDVLALFAEPARVRLLALLARAELSVAELTGITGMAQSRVSAHLARLRDAGVVRDRRAGTSAFYALNDGAMPAEARRVWELLRERLRGDRVIDDDRARCEAVLRARDGERPGQLEGSYFPGRSWESLARGLVGLLRLGDVLDAGSGDGAVAALVAPRARSVTCVDASERMVSAARARLATHPRARCVVGDLCALELADASFDQALALNVLASVDDPARAAAELARVLRPGGDLVVTTLDAHARPEATAAYGHKRPGFSPAALSRLLRGAGLDVTFCEVTSRERREPDLRVVTAFARKTDARAPHAAGRRTKTRG